MTISSPTQCCIMKLHTLAYKTLKDKLQGIGPQTQALHLGTSSSCVNIVFIQKHKLRGRRLFT